MTVHRNAGTSRHTMMLGTACHDDRDGRHDALMVILPALRLAIQHIYNLRP